MNKARRELARQETREALERMARTADALRQRESAKAARMMRDGAGKRTAKAGSKRAGSASYRPESGPVIATGAYAVIRNDAWARLASMLDL